MAKAAKSDISEFMTRDLMRVDAGASLLDAAKEMREGRVSYVLVEERGEAVGIITEADLARRAIPDRIDPLQGKVRDLMSRPLISVDVGTLMSKADGLMKTSRIRHLIITEKKKAVGMLTMLGLLRYYIKKSKR